MSSEPYLTWSYTDDIRHDDGVIRVHADLFARRDGCWRWAASVAAYVTAFREDGTTGEELGTPVEDGSVVADEATARRVCEDFIKLARLRVLGLA